MSNDIVYITTILTQAEYKDELAVLCSELRNAGISIDLSASTVARSWALKHFDDWFESQHEQVDDYLAMATIRFCDQLVHIGITSAFSFEGDIALHWAFHTDTDGDLAALFKLTFGGL